METAKLTKAALNKFIQWSNTRYNSYLNFGTKEEAVNKAYNMLLNQGEGVATFECAGAVGENPWSLGRQRWNTKQAGEIYDLNCKDKTIFARNSKRSIKFIL